ncbi:MAG: Grx4 family monothiol glutaredoxin [Deltaproteobacteria bacterium]|nr:Grx4 family monothiol glutaredoxin [Deltaproteobacteria bacterium]MBM4316186.1 Grx4 family monothiol glutaredoxin [Deltaproteobacteria bacterium]
MSTDIQNKIAEDVKNHKIIMYVKGSKGMPMCGFSKRVMDIFTDLGVDFETRDVLSDPEIREGVKQFTQWPTIPQIFINGEFVGGCDIVTDLFMSGELKKMVEAAK